MNRRQQTQTSVNSVNTAMTAAAAAALSGSPKGRERGVGKLDTHRPQSGAPCLEHPHTLTLTLTLIPPRCCR